MAADEAVVVAERIMTTCLLVSKYVGFIAVGLGVGIYALGGSVRYRSYAGGLVAGGTATIIIWLASSTLIQVLWFVAVSTGPVPEGGDAMLTPTMQGWAIADPNTSGSLYSVAGTVSKIALLIGQALVALGAAFWAVGRDGRRFSQTGRTYLKTGLLLLIVAFSGHFLMFLSYVFTPVLWLF